MHDIQQPNYIHLTDFVSRVTTWKMMLLVGRLMVATWKRSAADGCPGRAAWKNGCCRLLFGGHTHMATWKKKLRHRTSSTCTSLILMSYCLSIKTIKSYGNMGGASFNMNMADVKWVVLEIHFSVLKCNEPKLFTVPSKQPKPRNKYCRSTTCPPPRTY